MHTSDYMPTMPLRRLSGPSTFEEGWIPSRRSSGSSVFDDPLSVSSRRSSGSIIGEMPMPMSSGLMGDDESERSFSILNISIGFVTLLMLALGIWFVVDPPVSEDDPKKAQDLKNDYTIAGYIFIALSLLIVLIYGGMQIYARRSDDSSEPSESGLRASDRARIEHRVRMI
jgi:hypothetical protein